MTALNLFLVFIVVAIAARVVLARKGELECIHDRLAGLRRKTGKKLNVEEEEMALPFSQRVLRPLGESFYHSATRWMPARVVERTRKRLAMAGNPVEIGYLVFLKVLLAVATVLLYLPLLAVGRRGWTSPKSLALAIMSGFVAYTLPELWLSQQIARRRREIERSLPDVLDLLCISVEAGLGFDGAVQKVSEKFPDPTGGEFAAYLKEVRLGRPRAEALRALAARNEVPDLQTFTAAVIQADQLGVSLSTVLRVQSEQMRHKRRQQAEERAMQTPIKMLFPLVFFIFPTIFIVLLGPAIINLLLFFRQ